MTKKISKDEAKNLDLATQELQKGFTWGVHHSKMLMGIFAVFIFGGTIYSLAEYFSQHKEMQVQEKYYQIEHDYLTIKENKDFKPTGDLEKDYGSIVKGFEQFLSENKDTRPARMAAILLGEIYDQYKEPQKGLEAFKKVGTGSSDLLSGLILDRMAGLEANLGNCKNAIQDWDQLLLQKNMGFMSAEVKIKKGLCFEALKDFSQAQAMYTQAKEMDTQSSTGKRAEKYLRLLSNGESNKMESKN